MSKTTITLNGKQREATAGLTKVDAFYKEFEVNAATERLYLDKRNDIDIPLLPNDHIIIHGKESIVVGDIDDQIEDNPSVRSPIYLNFNGQKIEEGLKKAKLKSNELCSRDKELESPRLFADLEGKVDVLIKDGLTLVVQETDSFFTIPASKDDSINLAECSRSGRKVPKGQKSYTIKIDKEDYRVEQQEMTGEQLLGLAGKKYDEWSLNQKLLGGRRKPIEAEEIVDFSRQGIERFETVMRQAQQGRNDRFRSSR